jgi:hypothetical protein
VDAIALVTTLGKLAMRPTCLSSIRASRHAMTEPARGYKWPTADLGNTIAEKHGAFSDRIVAPLAEEIEADVLVRAPWCSRDGFAAGRRRYARAEAVTSLLWADVAEHGLFDDDGNPRPAFTALARWEATAANRGAALGLDPTSYAKLAATYATVPGGEDELEALNRVGALLVEAHDVATRPASLPTGTDHPTEAVRGAENGSERPEVTS